MKFGIGSRNISYVSLVSLLFLSACSTNAPTLERLPAAESSARFRVSVSSEGQDTKNFTKPLVHRFTFTDSTLAQIVTPREIRLPFAAKAVRDLQGEVKGLKVVNVQRAGTTLLGLQDNDLITAVGWAHVTSLQDFSQLFQQLRKERQATLTFERNGVPHKVFYFMDSASTARDSES